MVHDCREQMVPPPRYSFEQMFMILEREPARRVHLRMRSGADASATPNVAATGGITDHVVHRHNTRGLRYIEFPHGNRAYECCWGNMTNHQGKIDKSGQLIGHYIRNLERWADELMQRPQALGGK